MKARVAVLVTACLLWAGNLDAFEGRITVRPKASVEGARVRLGDIAELEGSATAFAGLTLVGDLAPAESRRLDGFDVLQRLRGAGVDLERVVYDIPATIAVAREFQEVSQEAIRRAVDGYFKRSAAQLTDLVIKRIDYQRPVRLAAEPYEIGVRALSRSPRQIRRRLVLEFRQQGRLVREIPATVEISAFAPAYFVKRVLRRGEVIAASDLVTRRADLSRLALGAITAPEQAVGMAAVRLLRPDMPLMASDLAPAVMVRRGDPITLVLETQSMKITTQGTAREDGAVGKEIRAINKQSGKEVRGRVVNGSVVVVEF